MLATTTVSLVDRIGALRAQIAPLARQLKKLEGQLKDQGAGRYAGEKYDATVTIFDREVLDMDAVKAKLSPQFLRAHTSLSPVVRLDIRARLLEVAA